MAQFITLGLGCLTLLICLALSHPTAAQPTATPRPPLPALQVHPLPPPLARWSSAIEKASGKAIANDYFDQIQPVDVGYLVWSQFPIQVYLEPLPAETALPFVRKQAQQWAMAVTQAVQEWSVYLPLTITDHRQQADIVVLRSPPPLRLGADGKLPRFRTAETRYDFYIRPIPNSVPILTHRFTILLRPNQSADYLRATARHELGHALGIWGHSPVPTDALYFSQVKTPPTISGRDINTLKRIYQQPTRLGWPVSL